MEVYQQEEDSVVSFRLEIGENTEQPDQKNDVRHFEISLLKWNLVQFNE